MMLIDVFVCLIDCIAAIKVWNFIDYKLHFRRNDIELPQELPMCLRPFNLKTKVSTTDFSLPIFVPLKL